MKIAILVSKFFQNIHQTASIITCFQKFLHEKHPVAVFKKLTNAMVVYTDFINIALTKPVSLKTATVNKFGIRDVQ